MKGKCILAAFSAYSAGRVSAARLRSSAKLGWDNEPTWATPMDCGGTDQCSAQWYSKLIQDAQTVQALASSSANLLNSTNSLSDSYNEISSAESNIERQIDFQLTGNGIIDSVNTLYTGMAGDMKQKQQQLSSIVDLLNKVTYTFGDSAFGKGVAHINDLISQLINKVVSSISTDSEELAHTMTQVYASIESQLSSANASNAEEIVTMANSIANEFSNVASTYVTASTQMSALVAGTTALTANLTTAVGGMIAQMSQNVSGLKSTELPLVSRYTNKFTQTVANAQTVLEDKYMSILGPTDGTPPGKGTIVYASNQLGSARQTSLTGITNQIDSSLSTEAQQLAAIQDRLQAIFTPLLQDLNKTLVTLQASDSNYHTNVANAVSHSQDLLDRAMQLFNTTAGGVQLDWNRTASVLNGQTSQLSADFVGKLAAISLSAGSVISGLQNSIGTSTQSALATDDVRTSTVASAGSSVKNLMSITADGVSSQMMQIQALLNTSSGDQAALTRLFQDYAKSQLQQSGLALNTSMAHADSVTQSLNASVSQYSGAIASQASATADASNHSISAVVQGLTMSANNYANQSSALFAASAASSAQNHNASMTMLEQVAGAVSDTQNVTTGMTGQIQAISDLSATTRANLSAGLSNATSSGFQQIAAQVTQSSLLAAAAASNASSSANQAIGQLSTQADSAGAHSIQQNNYMLNNATSVLSAVRGNSTQNMNYLSQKLAVLSDLSDDVVAAGQKASNEILSTVNALHTSAIDAHSSLEQNVSDALSDLQDSSRVSLTSTVRNASATVHAIMNSVAQNISALHVLMSTLDAEISKARTSDATFSSRAAQLGQLFGAQLDNLRSLLQNARDQDTQTQAAYSQNYKSVRAALNMVSDMGALIGEMYGKANASLDDGLNKVNSLISGGVRQIQMEAAGFANKLAQMSASNADVIGEMYSRDTQNLLNAIQSFNATIKPAILQGLVVPTSAIDDMQARILSVNRSIASSNATGTATGNLQGFNSLVQAYGVSTANKIQALVNNMNVTLTGAQQDAVAQQLAVANGSLAAANLLVGNTGMMQRLLSAAVSNVTALTAQGVSDIAVTQQNLQGVTNKNSQVVGLTTAQIVEMLSTVRNQNDVISSAFAGQYHSLQNATANVQSVMALWDPLRTSAENLTTSSVQSLRDMQATVFAHARQSANNMSQIGLDSIQANIANLSAVHANMTSLMSRSQPLLDLVCTQDDEVTAAAQKALSDLQNFSGGVLNQARAAASKLAARLRAITGLADKFSLSLTNAATKDIDALIPAMSSR